MKFKKEYTDLFKAQDGVITSSNRADYNPYNSPKGGEWQTVMHGTNAEKWKQTPDWQTDKSGKEFWNLDGDEAQKWLRGQKSLMEGMDEATKERFAYMLYNGDDIEFSKFKNPNNNKEQIKIQGRGDDTIYVPAGTNLGQFTPTVFNKMKSDNRGSYSNLSHPFYDQIGAKGPRTAEEKEFDFNQRNTPYQTEIQVGADNRTRGGWLYQGDDKDLTYKLNKEDMRGLPGSLQDKYRLNSRGAQLVKDPITGHIKVITEGKGSTTIQVDDLKYFENPGRLGTFNSDPNIKKGDNFFEYLNNPDFKYQDETTELDTKKINKVPSGKINNELGPMPEFIPGDDTGGPDSVISLDAIKPGVLDNQTGTVTNPNESQEDTRKGTVSVDWDEADNLNKVGTGEDTGGGTEGGTPTDQSINAVVNSYSTTKHVGTGEKYDDKDLKRDAEIIREKFGEEAYQRLMSEVGADRDFSAPAEEPTFGTAPEGPGDAPSPVAFIDDTTNDNEILNTISDEEDKQTNKEFSDAFTNRMPSGKEVGNRLSMPTGATSAFSGVSDNIPTELDAFGLSRLPPVFRKGGMMYDDGGDVIEGGAEGGAEGEGGDDDMTDSDVQDVQKVLDELEEEGKEVTPDTIIKKVEDKPSLFDISRAKLMKIFNNYARYNDGGTTTLKKNSKNYRDAYNEGALANYDPNTDSFVFPDLDEIKLTDDLPVTEQAIYGAETNPVTKSVRKGTDKAGENLEMATMLIPFPGPGKLKFGQKVLEKIPAKQLLSKYNKMIDMYRGPVSKMENQITQSSKNPNFKRALDTYSTKLNNKSGTSAIKIADEFGVDAYQVEKLGNLKHWENLRNNLVTKHPALNTGKVTKLNPEQLKNQYTGNLEKLIEKYGRNSPQYKKSFKEFEDLYKKGTFNTPNPKGSSMRNYELR